MIHDRSLLTSRTLDFRVFCDLVHDPYDWGPHSGNEPGKCPSYLVRAPLHSLVLFQGQIFAVRILAAKLLNTDLNFALDFWGGFFLLFLPRKRPQTIHQQETCTLVPKNSPRISAEALS